MTDRCNWSMGLSMVGGPALELDGHEEVEAYDKIEVTALKSGVAITVDVQPSGAGKLKGIMIMSDNYTDLAYKVDAVVTSHDIDGPLILMGSNIALLGSPVGKLIFTNSDPNEDANITILCVRTAVESA